ncbi:MAG TPA: bifunctional 4-hydroxy-2-oxoglutarate aldolase/2-dehydro-3-deoxy-phosphogluconate aldolase [Rudaea sp.]|jgi:2-dehydro-3-deoxyphosphogluconate aldolase/(4S)-4-hydroxy-2-oxoglutarate aldolase|nr:bifunctional 4-hydroxy-2-oxoglutarate aldolase/2-dehydro-3-deoxy-phosphogluconate aldolase [Rudaea sp.]HSC13189.1 bifunctional 4-hydroxy-2-oxoglutarate aldolase/2-dehydro-3-deoxy-phosphogluconate aldolase [Rhodanobacteraceae bacterium]
MSAIESKQARVEATLRWAPVVAVVVIESLADAVPLARALVSGGIKAIEVTLRTPVALDAIRAIAAEVDGAVTGAGTLLTPADIAAAEKAGARFGVSPGSTSALLDAADDSALPWLPGAATATEAMSLLERGYRFQKFFPATQAGGPDYLRALASPLPGIRFCPTGGITAASAPDWLALPNVVCVGGSWMSTAKLLRAGDWPAVEDLARAAAALRLEAK